jgi:hypothetical protein
MRATEADLVASRVRDVWRAKIAEARAYRIEPHELVAIAIDTGVAVQTLVTHVGPARAALDAVHAGLAASVFDDGACPPCPLGVVVVTDGAGNLTSTRYELALEAAGRPHG